MKKTKIALTAIAVLTAIGGAFATQSTVADLYAKVVNPTTQEEECILSCQEFGTETCDIAPFGYRTLQDCILEQNAVAAKKVQ